MTTHRRRRCARSAPAETDPLPNRPRTTPATPETNTNPTADEDAVTIYTPGEAAALLRVRESWLRRKAGARAIPCTFIGKHLRFSAADLHAIIDGGNHPRRST